MKILKIIPALVTIGLTPQSGQSQPLSSLRTDQNIEKGLKLGETYVDFYFLGFNHQNKALFTVDLVGRSLIYWVDPMTGGVIKKQYQQQFAPDSASLSPDGKSILAGVSPMQQKRGDIYLKALIIADSTDVKRYKSIYLGNPRIMSHPSNTLGKNKGSGQVGQDV